MPQFIFSLYLFLLQGNHWQSSAAILPFCGASGKGDLGGKPSRNRLGVDTIPRPKKDKTGLALPLPGTMNNTLHPKVALYPLY